MLYRPSILPRAPLKFLSIVWLLLADPSSVVAAQCGNGAGGFDNWLQHFKTQAAGQGITEPPQEPLAPPEVQPPPANAQEFDYQSFARSAEFANETLTAHNELRERHGAQPLRWSTELARTANDWALSMTSTRCEMEHSGGDVGGQR